MYAEYHSNATGNEIVKSLPPHGGVALCISNAENIYLRIGVVNKKLLSRMYILAEDRWT